MRALMVIGLGLAIAGPAAPAGAQTPLAKWTGVEGTLTVDFPPGWRRLDEKMRQLFPGSVEADIVMEMDKGDAIMGEPGVYCRVKLKTMPRPAGETAAAANKRMRDNPALRNLPPDPGFEKNVRVVGDAVAIESFKIAGAREDMIIWTSAYAKGDKILIPNMVCSPNVPRTGITAKDKADVQAMFKAISVSVK